MTTRLAEMRKKKGFTQEKLSEQSGVSRVYISQIERGTQTEIGSSVMLKLAGALGVSVWDIFLP